MATTTIGPEIVYPPGFDDRRESEMTDKGYLNRVVVRVDTGSRFLLNFIDPVRLAQDLQAENESGSPFFAEPGLVVVPRVTRESIRRAVAGLAGSGFFETQKPLSAGDP